MMVKPKLVVQFLPSTVDDEVQQLLKKRIGGTNNMEVLHKLALMAREGFIDVEGFRVEVHNGKAVITQYDQETFISSILNGWDVR